MAAPGRIWTAEVAPAEAAVGEKPAAGPIYRNTLAVDGYPTLEGVTSLYHVFTRSAEKYANNKLLGSRQVVDGKAGPFVWQTYKEAAEIAVAVGNAIRAAGVQPHGRCGIYGPNSPEWMLAMQACNAHSIYCVPLYDTLGHEAVKFIIKHAEVNIVFVQEAKVGALLDAAAECTETVKTVVSLGIVDEASKAKADSIGVSLHAWADFVELGKATPAEPVPPKADDICTIMYTSGTTGEPKGVILKHENVLAEIAAVKAFLDHEKFQFTEEDVFLSYLPLAHIMDRCMEEFFVYLGASIGYWQGDVKTLVDDIDALKPTYFAGVPRIFDRIYGGVTSKVEAAGGISKFLFNFGYRRKLTNLNAGKPSSKASPLFDALVFGKVKKRLGGRVRLILSGAAPLANHVEDFLRVTMCAPVIQGYGLTETCAGSFIAVPEANQSGTVGPPLPCLECRLEAVPEMNYDPMSNPPRGEICLRGPTVFAGYYKREDLTKEALDADGWFHTGDVGEWQPNGTLRVIDRKKNIFKLSQGEYVAVENLENILGQTPGVDAVWVYGNSFEPCLVGVVVPNEAHLTDWAKTAGVEGDVKTICTSDAAKKYMLEQLTATGKKGKLKGFEMVKAVHLEPVPFDLERDLLTPTFKKKRPQLLQYYKADIDAMYATIKAAAPAEK